MDRFYQSPDVRLLFFIIALACWCGFSYAGTVGTPTEATYEVGGEALYLQPNYGNLNVHALKNVEPQLTTFSNFNLPYTWGFDIWAGYYFNQENDVRLVWYNLTGSGSRFEGNVVTTTDVELSNSSTFTNTQWNAVYLDLGQQVNAFSRALLRIYGGIAYVNIDTSWDGTAMAGTTPGESRFHNLRVFNGVGSRVGADVGFKLTDRLRVYNDVTLAMFAGTKRSGASFENLRTPTREGAIHTVVPEVGLKLGLNTRYKLFQGVLTVDAGWMWRTYFDAILTDLSQLQNDLTLISSNFSLQGLAFGLSWKGDLG